MFRGNGQILGIDGHGRKPSVFALVVVVIPESNHRANG